MAALIDYVVILAHALSTIIGIWVAYLTFKIAKKNVGVSTYWTLFSMAAILNVTHGVMFLIKVGLLFNLFSVASLMALVQQGMALPLPSGMYAFAHTIFAIQGMLFAVAGFMMLQFYTKLSLDMNAMMSKGKK
ncbi:hypothetical protein C0585_08505 [Candidatus Woesearchaeota archaeon]|nr:MAG: hypothetical protein C0585_08505 [Candidatus Woesearchaeota archaeon]